MVTLELNEQQAAVIKALTGHITGDINDSWRQHSSNVFFAIGNGIDEDLYQQVSSDVMDGTTSPYGIRASSILPPKVFNVEEVKQSIRDAVDVYGHGWVDPNAGAGTSGGCMNNYTDEEGRERHCLAGWVFADLIEPSEAQGSARAICSTGGQFEGRFTGEAIDLLQYAQELQDRGAPWGAVLHAVKNR